MDRRKFLTALSSVPFLGWLNPSHAEAVTTNDGFSLAIDLFRHDYFEPGEDVEYPLDFIVPVRTYSSISYAGKQPHPEVRGGIPRYRLDKGPDFVRLPLYETGPKEIEADCERVLLAAANAVVYDTKDAGTDPWRVKVKGRVILVGGKAHCVIAHQSGRIGIAVLDTSCVVFEDELVKPSHLRRVASKH